MLESSRLMQHVSAPIERGRTSRPEIAAFRGNLTMPMPQRVQFSDAIEPLVQFIEDTSPSEILDRTLEKIRSGVPTQTMLTASALAVTRSTDMPPGHHGGSLHALAGLYAVSKLVAPLEGEQRFLPALR